MTWYEFLLFVHVTCAVIWLGGSFFAQAYATVVHRNADPHEMAAFAGTASRLAERLFVPASLLVLLAGIGLMIEGSWDWGQLWIVFALVVFAASFVTGLFHISPLGKRIERVGPETEEGQALIATLFRHLRVDLLFMFAIVFAMTVKPTGDDGWTIAGAVVVLVAGSAFFLLRGRPTPVSAPQPH